MESVFLNIETTMKQIVCSVDLLDMNIEDGWKQILDIYTYVKQNGKRLYFIGNGGSAAIAIHMTNDFFKNGGICTHSLHDPALMTCLANDFGYEYVFSKQLELAAQAGDVLTAISSSGNSRNIINAVEIAKGKGCVIVTLSGFKEDNCLRRMGDVNLYVPSMEYGVVETIHNMILQQVVDDIVKRDGVGLK